LHRWKRGKEERARGMIVEMRVEMGLAVKESRIEAAFCDLAGRFNL